MLWIILTLLSALFLSFVDIISKSFFNKKTINPLQLNFSVSFFVTVFVFLFFFNQINFSLSLTSLGLVFLKVLFLLSFNYLYLSLLNTHDVSKIVPLNNLSPIMLLALSSFFLHEFISLLNLLGIFVIIFSTYYLEVIIENHNSKSPIKSHKLKFKQFNLSFALKVMLMLFVISCCAIVDRILLKTITVYSNIAFTYSFMVLFLVICLIYNKSFFNTIKLISTNPIFLVQGALSLFSVIFVLQALSIPSAQTSLIIPMKRTSTLMAAFIGGFLFHETHMKQKLLAIGFMLIGIILIAM